MAIPRDTRAQFVNKSRRKWGDRYGYQKVDYVNSRTPVLLWCKKHQLYFKQTPKAHFAAKHECCPACYSLVAGTFQNEWRNNIKLTTKPAAPKTFYLINQVFSAF